MHSQKEFKPIYGSFSGREDIEVITKNTQKNMARKVPFNIGYPPIKRGSTKIKVTLQKSQDFGKEQKVSYSQAVVKAMSPAAALLLVQRKIAAQTSSTVITNGNHSSTLEPSIGTQVSIDNKHSVNRPSSQAVSSISNKSTSENMQSHPSSPDKSTTMGSNSHISNANNPPKNADISLSTSVNSVANFSSKVSLTNTSQQNNASNSMKPTSITAHSQKNGFVNGNGPVVWNGINSNIKESSPSSKTVRSPHINQHQFTGQNSHSGNKSLQYGPNISATGLTGVGNKEPLAKTHIATVASNNLSNGTTGKTNSVWNGVNGSLKEQSSVTTEKSSSKRPPTSNNAILKDSTPIKYIEQKESENKNITSSVTGTPSSSRRSSESNSTNSINAVKEQAPKNNTKYERKKGNNETKASSGINTPTQSNTPVGSRRSSTSNGSNTIVASKEPVSAKNATRQMEIDSKSNVSNSNGVVPSNKSSTNWAVHLFPKDESQKSTTVAAENFKPNVTKPPSLVNPQKSQRPVVPPINEKPKLTGLLKDFNPSDLSFQNVRMSPRGLINNGNMCFMNAILQTLSHCPPFCNLLTRIHKEVALSFKTPLVESLVNFIEEYKQTKRSEGSEEFGEAFSPEKVYNALRKLKRFDSMKGRQEDAEEFLGFLLDGLHEEFLAALKTGSKNQQPDETVKTNQKEDDWMEVGRKNRANYTRTTDVEETPISRIFGGRFRSVLTCGSNDSITQQPYQSLQLDIQPDDVKTIGDALKNLTVPEYVDDFYSPKNGLVRATKRLYIETLPPILTLHLKRFIYDNVGGTQKLSKHIGYSTTLSIQPDIIAQARRPNKAVEYQLFGVVYHHGKSATGGHYTADILCQNDWFHIDDAAISLISSEEVALVENPTQPTDRSAYILFYKKSVPC